MNKLSCNRLTEKSFRLCLVHEQVEVSVDAAAQGDRHPQRRHQPSPAPPHPSCLTVLQSPQQTLCYTTRTLTRRRTLCGVLIVVLVSVLLIACATRAIRSARRSSDDQLNLRRRRGADLAGAATHFAAGRPGCCCSPWPPVRASIIEWSRRVGAKSDAG